MEAFEDQNKLDRIKTWLGTGSINLFGLPFSGKDTHGHVLARQLDGVLIGGGDILRNTGTTPAHVLETIDKGHLAPTSDYLRIMLPYFSQPEFKGKPLILSSVGRWHGEEAGVLEATAAAGHPVMIVIHLKISEAELHRRWQTSMAKQDRGPRKDDEQQRVAKRISEYRTKTVPVLQFYREQGMLLEVSAMDSIAAVSQTILDQLYQLANT